MGLVVLVAGSFLVTSTPAILMLVAGIACLFIATTVLDHQTQTPWLSWSGTPAAAFFAFGVIAIVLGATAWSPGGSHPIWSFVSESGSASIDRQADWIGLLKLFGLLFAFLVACHSGSQSRSARSVTATLLGLGTVMGLVVLGFRIFRPDLFQSGLGTASDVSAPILSDPGVRGGVFGVLAILSVEAISRELRGSSRIPKSRLKSHAPIWLAAAPYLVALFVFALCLALTTSLSACLNATAMVILFLAWTALTGGKNQDVPRRVALWLVPAVALLAGVTTWLITQKIPQSPAAILSDKAHWSAIQASPWLGYGLDTISAVNNLFMTSTNQAALATFPVPPNAYFALLLEEGFLAIVPLLAAIIWIGGAPFLASLRPRQLSGHMRAAVCSLLFILLFALNSSGPSTFSMGVLIATILGLGFGVATAL